ncbi:hypothetical protein STRIP9103_06064 [Streptomyces ipomoeae 91-03]|jgi:lipoprotein-anchoring transpeptidase ErfK/SrfK|uniref:L,D-TPase catalytic domain-containing protein n=2 Tax=Streptomyces ipomoeae TaxID=103232 RepID=L1L5A9_9ACTN|nr:hypothetical protein STRIP9103_06064 [Streptomyces ipomoeae 91-03]
MFRAVAVQIDTPDQVLPPLVYTPSTEEEAVEPMDAVAGTYDLIESVPLGEAEAVARGKVTCTTQLTWVQKGKKVVFGPAPIRSGRTGYPTRGGWHRIYWRHKNHWSTLYHQPMPYSQFFSGGQAFHAVYGSLYTEIGSMGCVNLRVADARALWEALKTGDRVFVWGKRAGR